MTGTATVHLPEELTGDRSLEQEWAQRMRTAWQDSVAAIIECGRVLMQAKDALSHGRFEAMVEAEGLFSVRTAQRLMATGFS